MINQIIVNSILSSCADGQLTFDDAMVLSEFYRDYSDTNSIIAAAEQEVVDDVDRLLSDTVYLLSGIEKFAAVGVTGIQLVDLEQLFELHVKPFEERYKSAKAVSTKLWQEYSAMSNRLDFLPLDSDEYKNSMPNAKRRKPITTQPMHGLTSYTTIGNRSVNVASASIPSNLCTWKY